MIFALLLNARYFIRSVSYTVIFYVDIISYKLRNVNFRIEMHGYEIFLRKLFCEILYNASIGSDFFTAAYNSIVCICDDLIFTYTVNTEKSLESDLSVNNVRIFTLLGIDNVIRSAVFERHFYCLYGIIVNDFTRIRHYGNRVCGKDIAFGYVRFYYRYEQRGKVFRRLR